MKAWSFITSRLKNHSLQYNRQFMLGPLSCSLTGKVKHWWLRGKDGGRRDKVAFLCDLRVRARKYHLVLTVQSQVNINVSVLFHGTMKPLFCSHFFFFFLFWTANAPWLTSFTWSCIKVMIKEDSGICSPVWELLGVVGKTRIQVVEYSVDLICISA